MSKRHGHNNITIQHGDAQRIENYPTSAICVTPSVIH